MTIPSSPFTPQRPTWGKPMQARPKQDGKPVDHLYFGAGKPSQSTQNIPAPRFWNTVQVKSFGQPGSAWYRKLYGFVLYPFVLLAAVSLWLAGKKDWFKPKAQPAASPTPSAPQASTPPALRDEKDDSAPPSPPKPKVDSRNSRRTRQNTPDSLRDAAQGASPTGSSEQTLQLRIPSATQHSGKATPVKPTEAPLTLTKAQQQLIDTFEIPYKFRLYRAGGAEPPKNPAIVTPAIRAAKSVALGDLHGSFRKLLDNLVVGGFISMPQKTAQELVKCSDELEALMVGDAYCVRTMDPETMAQVKDLYLKMGKLIPQIQWTGGDRRFILIGDEIADRGPLDTVTLDILEHLTKDHPERIIRLASNHSHTALEYLYPRKDPKTGRDYRALKCAAGQQASMQWAFALAEEMGNVPELVEKYRRHLTQCKLMYYVPESKTLYTHAPVSVQVYQDMVKGMEENRYFARGKEKGNLKRLRYENVTAETLPRVADYLNAAYQQYVQESVKREKPSDSCEEILHPFLWTRGVLDQEKSLLFKDKGVQRHIFGHDDQRQGHGPYDLTNLANSDRQPAPGQYVVATLDQNIYKGCETRENRQIIGSGGSANRLYLEP